MNQLKFVPLLLVPPIMAVNMVLQSFDGNSVASGLYAIALVMALVANRFHRHMD